MQYTNVITYQKLSKKIIQFISSDILKEKLSSNQIQKKIKEKFNKKRKLVE
jgi:hypothetical protein